ncbi:MAG: alpha/beta fold hydrolase, partial [Desulfomonilaceae bacterium]
CYDRRGFGQSDEGPDFFNFYVSDKVRSESVKELELLRHWLGIDSFYILGQCEGGVIAADYALKYPARVRNMAISSTLCYSSMKMHEFNLSKFVRTFDQLDPELRTKLIGWHGDRTEILHNQFRQFGGAYGKDFFDLRPILKQINCPTLVLYPDRSFLFEVEQGVEFYRNLPQGALAVLPNCGHNTYDEQPNEYVYQIVKFFDRKRLEELPQFEGYKASSVTCVS